MLRRWRERRLFQRLALAAVPIGEQAVTNAVASIRSKVEQQHSDLEALLQPSSLSPRCPLCGSRLVIRLARKGRNAGSEFWGCSTWPRCTYTAGLGIYDTNRSPFQSYA
ncbi:MAG: topoisomerase DNA-binding C4 zinc finger domain-containing protein [Gaiellaceae bacterium]